jgi:hypothetical protein
VLHRLWLALLLLVLHLFLVIFPSY